jgi:CDGSH iron-sulfur domain-containing protein 3
MTTIKVRHNGPYVIEGEDVQVVDWNGREYPIARRPIALCRCGRSKNRPFCDRSHQDIGFSAEECAPDEEAR